MLKDSEDVMEMAKSSSQKCVPDYESMIKRIKAKMNDTFAFRDAAMSYFDGRQARGKMAELIGELVTECNLLQRKHDSLIKDQEDA